jgi:hypothetical protein
MLVVAEAAQEARPSSSEEALPVYSAKEGSVQPKGGSRVRQCGGASFAEAAVLCRAVLYTAVLYRAVLYRADSGATFAEAITMGAVCLLRLDLVSSSVPLRCSQLGHLQSLPSLPDVVSSLKESCQ